MVCNPEWGPVSPREREVYEKTDMEETAVCPQRQSLGLQSKDCRQTPQAGKATNDPRTIPTGFPGSMALLTPSSQTPVSTTGREEVSVI